jgi:hypothetical protein
MASTDDGTGAAQDATAQSAASAPAPGPGAGTESGAEYTVTAADAPPAGGAEAPPKPESLTDAIADLMQMAVNYMRQETAGVMRDKVVLPGQQLGRLVAFAFAAAGLLFLGIGFISVAVLLVLAYFLGWPGALALIGVILLIGASVFTYLKVRSIQT